MYYYIIFILIFVLYKFQVKRITVSVFLFVVKCQNGKFMVHTPKQYIRFKIDTKYTMRLTRE